MDDIVIRPRYPRRSVTGKKRKKYSAEKSSINVLLARQIFVSLLILIIAFAAKHAGSPLAVTVQEKIKYALTANIDIGGVLSSIEKSFSDSWNSKSIDGNTSAATGQVTGQTTVQTSDSVSGQVSDQSQVAGQNKSSSQSQASGQLPGSANTDSNSTGSSAAQADDASVAASGSSGSIVMVTAPLKGKLSSAFGERTDPVTGIAKMHEGIDIEADKGESIVAALGGTVVEAGVSKTYGNYIKIKHQGNLTTVYAHCSSIAVVEGQTVKQGQVIAEVGSTGASIGDHLHFEIWNNGKAVNPLDYVSISD